MVELRVETVPRWPLRLPRGSADGLLRTRGGVLERVLHVGDVPVRLRAAQPAADRVLLGVRATCPDAARAALGRWRATLGVDDDLRDFHARFADDALIGRSVRTDPHLRLQRRAEPFEALAWAICEQLIEYPRAVAIERRIIRRWGRRCPDTGLVDAPSAVTLAGVAPAELQACDLSAGRSIALIRAAREVARGRVDLLGEDHEAGWARLRRIPGIGSWTLELLATQGQGRHDQLPAGDLNLRKLVGRLRAGGDPSARAPEDEVRAFFAPYGEWAALAASHALRATRSGLAGAPGVVPGPRRGRARPPAAASAARLAA